MSRTSVTAVIKKFLDTISGGCRERRTQGVNTARQAAPAATSIHIRSCAPSETIVVETGSSVYELIVLRGDYGHVLVRGGKHFSEFRRVLFVGSMRNGSPVERYTIDLGLRMRFYFENRVITTSAVQSLTRRLTSAAATKCAATE